MSIKKSKSTLSGISVISLASLGVTNIHADGNNTTVNDNYEVNLKFDMGTRPSIPIRHVYFKDELILPKLDSPENLRFKGWYYQDLLISEGGKPITGELHYFLFWQGEKILRVL